MDAPTSYQDQLLFHATGQRTGAGWADVDPASLRPALMAPFRDLTRLRHDFPLVLLDEAGPEGCALPLATIVSRLAVELAPRGIEGERLRRHLLRVEREIRTRVLGGGTGTLRERWAEAVASLTVGADETAARVLAQAGESLKADGESPPHDATTPD